MFPRTQKALNNNIKYIIIIQNSETLYNESYANAEEMDFNKVT